MKIRFVKSVLVEIEKPKMDEVWDKYFHRWDEVNVESIQGNDLITYNGDILKNVSSDAYEVLSPNGQSTVV